MDETRQVETLEQMLESGRQALTAGDRTAAHEIWRTAAVAHPYDERVWVALLQVLDRVDDQQVCLENIIAINPVNTDARRQLRVLKRDRRLRLEKLEEQHSAKVKPLPEHPAKTRKSMLTRAIVVGIGLGLLAVLLGVVISIVVYGWLVPTGVL